MTLQKTCCIHKLYVSCCGNESMCVLNCCADEINVSINRQLYPPPMLWQLLLGIVLPEQESRLVYAYDKIYISTDLQTLNCTLSGHFVKTLHNKTAFQNSHRTINLEIVNFLHSQSSSIFLTTTRTIAVCYCNCVPYMNSY